MSHKANYWLASLDPTRVKSGAFRVLFHLCDHHNEKTDPRTCCYPSQETLRKRTGLSNGALNAALAEMEVAGLLIRRRSTVPGTSERRTYYILGCDFDLLQEQTPENGDCSNSGQPETAKKLTPISEGANSNFKGGKLRPTGEEPIRTLKNLDDDDSARARVSDLIDRLCNSGVQHLVTTDGMGEAAKWLAILDAETIMQSITEQKARAKAEIRSLAYFTPELVEVAARRAEPLPTAAPAGPAKQKPKRDHDALMRAALARLNEDGSLRL